MKKLKNWKTFNESNSDIYIKELSKHEIDHYKNVLDLKNEYLHDAKWKISVINKNYDLMDNIIDILHSIQNKYIHIVPFDDDKRFKIYNGYEFKILVDGNGVNGLLCTSEYELIIYASQNIKDFIMENISN